MRKLGKIISVTLGAAMMLAMAGGCSGGSSESSGVTKMLEERTLLSPDGNLEMKFGMSEEGTPVYSLDYKGR